MFFYLYMIVDIYSRKIITWEIHEEQSDDLAALLIKKAYLSKIGDIFISDLNDPVAGMISILGVRLSADKSIANVYYSILVDENKEDIIKKVNHAVSFVRRLLSQRIHLRYVPRLVFIEDTSIQYSIYIEKRIDEICKRKDDNEDEYSKDQ